MTILVAYIFYTHLLDGLSRDVPSIRLKFHPTVAPFSIMSLLDPPSLPLIGTDSGPSQDPCMRVIKKVRSVVGILSL